MNFSAWPTSAAIRARHGHARLVRGLHHEHAEVGGDKLVAAATRVQLVAERAKKFDQRGLHEMVHILGGRTAQPGKIVHRALGDFVERGQRVAHLLDGKYAGRFESAGPHPVHGQLVRQQAAVKRERPLKLVEHFVGSAVKPPAPQFSRRLFFGRGGHFTFASSGMVTGSANKLMKPSASFGL